MEEIRSTTLGEICTGNGGTIQTGPFGSQLHRSDYREFGVPVIMPTNIRNGRIVLDGIAYIAEADAERLGRHRAKPGDIIFSRRGEVDKCAVVTEREAGWLCGTGCLLARINLGKADPNYVGYRINFDVTRLWLRQHAVGLVMPNLNTGILSRIPLTTPGLSEQRKIAAVLSAIDDKIELNRRMNETLEVSARALFQDWFVDFGPTRAKAEGRPAYLAPDLWSLFPDRLGDGGVPEGWEWESLLDQANWVNGAAYKNMHFVDRHEGLPVVKIAELKAGVSGQTKFTNTDLGARYRIDDGELLFSWSGNPDTSIDAFVWTGGAAWLNQHIFAVRENDKRTKAELFVLLKWLMPQFAEIARNKQTTGLGHVTKDDMKRLRVVLASRGIRRAFSHCVAPIFDQFLSNITESRTLAATRDALLPKLMSGEIRVREAEALAA